MIRKKEAGIYREYESLLDALGLAKRRDVRVCAVGAGGKTSLLKCLASEYRQRDIPVAVTTTTHMYAEEKPWFLLEQNREKAAEILSREGVVFLGRPDRDGKMRAPDEAWMQEILALPFPVLIEGDGARMLPLKAPGGREPVIPACVTHVLSVYGMQALGGRMQDVCFRADLAAGLLGRRPEDPVREEDIALLAAHPEGGRKAVPERAACITVLAQADLPGRMAAAERIGRAVPGEVLLSGRMEDRL